MKRIWQSISSEQSEQQQLILWLCRHYTHSAFLSGNGWNSGQIAAFGIVVSTDNYEGSLIERLQQLTGQYPDWTFGHLGYNLKSEIENISSHYPNEDGFTDLFFFVPEIVVLMEDGNFKCGAQNEASLSAFIALIKKFTPHSEMQDVVEIKGTTARTEYLEQCNKLLSYIHRGDIYELNYCVDFVANTNELDPALTFTHLSAISEAPFSALYRQNNSWLLSASPERFLMKTGKRLMSQPIKGTRARSSNPNEDRRLKNELVNDEKERSENVMIVDLVRNDLSRVAEKKSVCVTELFGIHTFKTVHQMISTVECNVRKDVTLSEIITATFPMGSMTGAPKISAMQLAEQHEKQSRGIYSGSVGYITPEGDFDFNVVIRSITWNSETGHVSAKAGGAITANSVPEKEYEECLLKAKAMMQVLNPARVYP